MDCDWNNPGINSARPNNVAEMISHYGYPKSDIAQLVEKIRTKDNDGVVVITKNGLIGINGTVNYFGDMHFRNGMCTGAVKVDKWSNERQEKAMVYCSVNNNCVAIPTICGNITKIEWQPRTKKEPELNPVSEFNHVPEPSYLLLLATSILLLVFNTKKI